MINDAPAPYPRGGEVLSTEVMLFRSNEITVSEGDVSALPDTLVAIYSAESDDAVRGAIPCDHRDGAAFRRLHRDGNAGREALERSGTGKSESRLD